MSLADILERAASALPEDADSIRPANGDPIQLLGSLSPEAAARVLTWLLCHEPAGGAELAQSWVDDEGGADVLAEIAEGDLPKAGRKGLRRALHRLRSRGVAVPKPAPGPVVARLPDIEDDLEAAFVSAIDPRGTRLVYLVEPNPSGGARLFEVLLDEDRGLVDFEVYSAGRSRIRRFVKEAVSGSRFAAVPASPESVRALVARIADLHPADRALPKSFSEWRSSIAVSGTTPGDLAVAALADSVGDTAEPLDRAVELVRKGSLGPWGPPARRLAEGIEGLLEEEAKRDPGEERWSIVAGEMFRDERGEAAARRFEESAYVLWKLDQADDARACLAAATAFRDASPEDNSVAAACAQALLEPALSALRSRPKERPEERPDERAAEGQGD
jgi:hypothetical protein